IIGLIYEVANADRSIVYIGSTVQTIGRRWSHHKSNYKTWLDGDATGCSIYHHFKEHGIDSFRIRAISKHAVESSRELIQFEQLVIDKTECVNERRGQFTVDRSTYDKYYYNKNRDKINEKFDCDCGGKYTRKNRYIHVKTMRHREWQASQ
ncbi:TPA: hypothetical protein N0F65_006657, partial [Lagenidium giganteum]